MKVRDSGMPDKGMWEDFFNPAGVLARLTLDGNTVNVAEFGCGYGTFTIPAAKIIRGTIYALDIEPEMVKTTQDRAAYEGLNNVKTILRDFVDYGSGLKDNSVDFVMLFNILHFENPVALLREAYRILTPGGKTGVIHWNYDASTPRGPSLSIRPKPEQCRDWMKEAGFALRIPIIQMPPHHYGIVGIK